MNINDYFEVSQLSVNRLDEINSRLTEIADELKKYQPPIDGRLTLELTKCSTGGCLSCLHPRWKTWRWINKRRGGKFFTSKDVDDPWRRVKAAGEFKENYDYIKALVLEGRDLIEEKAYYIKGFQKLRVAVKKTERKNNS